MTKLIINSISALMVAVFFMALLYTMPKAIMDTSQMTVRYALLNLFFLSWFTILFKGTIVRRENFDAGE